MGGGLGNVGSDGCGGKTIPTAIEFGYDRLESKGYLGNIGSLVDWTPRRWRLGRFQVCPYFFLSGLGGVLAVVFVVFWWSPDYPAESDLVKVSGEIASVVVSEDIFNTGPGAMMAGGHTSTYFTLKGVDGEFRYPSTHPKYFLVRDRTAVAIDVWVDGAEMGSGRPLVIWQIREHNPHNYRMEETSVSHAEVIEWRIRIDRSRVEAGYWLPGISGALALVGVGVRRWNRGRPPAIS